MLQKLESGNHPQPFKGPFSITRILPGKVLGDKSTSSSFGPLSNVDHAVMQKGLTIKMHEHVNDEILSYVVTGTSIHRDSAGYEVPISRGKLMLMNAGASFWHEEKVKEDHLEMLQIFVRPFETDLPAEIQFHDKPVDNRDWYLMVGPKGSDAPLYVRQNVYIMDAHMKAGDSLEVPIYEGLKPFLYVMSGEIQIGEILVGKQEAVADDDAPLPAFTAKTDATVVLFVVDLKANMSMAGTISGMAYEQ